MTTKSFCALSLVLAAAAAPAQTPTYMHSPKEFVIDGNTNNNIPYSWYPTRYQQVYDAASFDVQAPIKAANLYYRMAGSGGSYGGQVVELAIWLGFAAKGVDATSATGTFASNIDATSQKLVVQKTKFNMPKLPNTNWDIKLPFDSGAVFVYGPVLGQNLVIETRVYGNDQSNKNFTYPIDAWQHIGTSVTNGTYTGCPSSNPKGAPPSHSVSTSTLKIGTTASFTGSGYVASTPAVMSLGGTTLALTMPGTSCQIVNDLLLLFPGLADASGNYAVPLPIPNDNSLGSISFLTQMFFFDQAANSVGITSSRGLVNTLAPYMTGVTCRVYSGDSTGLGNPDTFTSGSITRNYGLVTRLSD
ncbi:MAG: hypothetical protein R3F30_03060 [Planctomycetota bacterium]